MFSILTKKKILYIKQLFYQSFQYWDLVCVLFKLIIMRYWISEFYYFQESYSKEHKISTSQNSQIYLDIARWYHIQSDRSCSCR
jgi:hypothetical protein